MHTGHFELIVAPYRLAWDRGLPDSYNYDRQREEATLVDRIALSQHEAALVGKTDLGKVDVAVGVLSVGHATGGWPFLVIEHSYVLPWTEDELRLDACLCPRRTSYSSARMNRWWPTIYSSLSACGAIPPLPDSTNGDATAGQ